MPLPDCVTRLLPRDLPFETISNFNTEWTAKGIPITPIFRTKDNSTAVCDTQQQIIPSMREIDEGEVWYSIDYLVKALNIARRLNIKRVFLTQIAVKGKASAPLAIIGKDAQIAIVLAPTIAWDDGEIDGSRTPEADI